MADVLSRIVSPPVGLDRASWQGTKRQGDKENKKLKRSLPSAGDSDASGATGIDQPAANESEKDKGHRLDLNA